MTETLNNPNAALIVGQESPTEPQPLEGRLVTHDINPVNHVPETLRPAVEDMGEIAVSEEVTLETSERDTHPSPFVPMESGLNFLRTISRGLATNIPVENFKTTRIGKRDYIGFAIRSFDTMSPGIYTIEATDLHDKVTNNITIHQDGENRYISGAPSMDLISKDDPLTKATEAIPFETSLPPFLGGDGNDAMGFARAVHSTMKASSEYLELFKRAGFHTTKTEANRETVNGYPTPETIKGRLQEWGVKVKLVDGSSKTALTKLEDYVGAFAEASYPIGVGGSLEGYIHDIRDDHLPGVMAAGQPALGMLKPIAEKALELDPSNMSKILEATGRGMDDITFKLSNSFLNSAYKRRGESVTGQLENAYKAMCELVGIEYNEGDFSDVVLGGFIDTAERIGWGEDIITNLQSQRRAEITANQ